MAEFVSYIRSYIEQGGSEVLGPFAWRDDYQRYFRDVFPTFAQSISYKHIPSGLFENFDYKVYRKAENQEIDINLGNVLERLPEYFRSGVNRITTINGYYSERYSDITSEGLQAVTMDGSSKLSSYETEKYFSSFFVHYETPLSIINSLLAPDGTHIIVNENAKILKPIVVVNVITEEGANAFINTRKIFDIRQNASATIYETTLVASGQRSFLSNIAVGIQGENSTFQYHPLNCSFDNADLHNVNNINGLGFHLANGAELNTFNFHSGYGFDRRLSRYVLAGEGAKVTISTLSKTNANEITENLTLVAHKVKNASADQLVKGIVDGYGKFVFTGEIEVQQDACGTFSAQKSSAVLLSDNASVEFMPQLEINNDDVLCSHGASIGELDQDSIFYLKTRGIGEDEAKWLLLGAFAEELLDRGNIPADLRKYFTDYSPFKENATNKI